MSVLIGCGSPTAEVSGKVTYQGKSVVYGIVSAICADGLTRTVNITEDGTYRFENLPAGPVQLGVTSPEPPDPDDRHRRGERAGAVKSARPKAVDRSKWFSIPDKYADPRTSGQSTTVTPGAITFNIELS